MTEDITVLIQRLEYYNNWRRQDCDPLDPERLEMPDTKQLGKDIDSAIGLLREYAVFYNCQSVCLDDQEMRLDAEEYECAMMYLDKKGIPRFSADGDSEYSLVGRIELYASLKTKQDR